MAIIRKTVLFISLFFSHFFCINAIDITKIKGTYDCLKDDYKYLSPINGAVFWEVGIIENMYRLGISNVSSTKLVRSLFYLLKGNFDVAKAVHSVSTFLTPFRIGKILGAIEKLRGKGDKSLFEKEFKAIISGGLIAKEIQDLDKKLKVINRKLKNINKNKKKKNIDEKMLVELNKQNKDAELEKIPLIESKKRLETEVKKFIKVKESAYKRLVDSILNVLDESGFFKQYNPEEGKDFYSFPFTVHNILLSLLYRNSKTKSDFKEFFEAFRQTLNIDEKFFYKYQLDESWLKSEFVDNDVNEFIVTIKEKTKEKSFDWFYQSYERIVYSEIINQYYSGIMPVFSNWFKDTKYQSEVFTDCVENTIANIINVLFYDKESRAVDLNSVSNNGLYPIDMLVDFYEKHPTFNDLNEEERHSDWCNIVSNLPGVPYFNAIRIKDNMVFRKSYDSPFIYGIKGKEVDDKEEIEIEGKKYTLVNPKKYKLYEIAPGIPTFILIINELLNLNLFTDFENAYKEKNFNRIKNILGWKVVNIKKEDENTVVNVKTEKDQEFTISWGSAHSDVVSKKNTIKFSEYIFDLFKNFWSKIESYFGDKNTLDNLFCSNLNLLSLYNTGLLLYEKELDFDEEFIKNLLTKHWINDGRKYFGSVMFYLNYIYPKNPKVIVTDSSQSVIIDRGRSVFIANLLKQACKQKDFDRNKIIILIRILNSCSEEELEYIFFENVANMKSCFGSIIAEQFNWCSLKTKIYYLESLLYESIIDDFLITKIKKVFDDILLENDKTKIKQNEDTIVDLINMIFSHKDILEDDSYYEELIKKINEFIKIYIYNFSDKSLNSMIFYMLGGDSNDLETYSLILDKSPELNSYSLDLLELLVFQQYKESINRDKFNKIIGVILEKYTNSEKLMDFILTKLQFLTPLNYLKLAADLLMANKFDKFEQNKDNIINIVNSFNLEESINRYIYAFYFYYFRYNPLEAIDFIFDKLWKIYLSEDEKYDFIKAAILDNIYPVDEESDELMEDEIYKFKLETLEKILEKLKEKINLLEDGWLKDGLRNILNEIPKELSKYIT